MKPTSSLPVIGVMLAALAVIAVVSWVTWSWIGGKGTAGSQNVVMRTEANIGGPFTLTNHKGDTVTDESFRGKYMLVFFGYGYCPDICPTELASIAATLDVMGPQAEEVTPLFITIDPERDTPEFLADFVVNFHPRMIGLTGAPEAIGSVAKSYKVFYAKSRQSAGPDYLMDHSSFIYLMGPDGKFITMFRPQTDPKKMAETIDKVISQQASAASGTG